MEVPQKDIVKIDKEPDSTIEMMVEEVDVEAEEVVVVVAVAVAVDEEDVDEEVTTMEVVVEDQL